MRYRTQDSQVQSAISQHRNLVFCLGATVAHLPLYLNSSFPLDGYSQQCTKLGYWNTPFQSNPIYSFTC